MAIKLELRDMSSGDVDKVWTWLPPSPSDVFLQVTIEIGEKGITGGHLFQFVAATPEAISRVHAAHPTYRFPDRNLLVFSEYSADQLRTRILRILSECERDDWNLSIASLQRYFQWEYEL